MKGGCHCGAIIYSTTKEPFAAEYCHCRDCQKITGAPVAAWMDFKVEQIQWETGMPTEYKSSENIIRGFCSKCGSTLSYRSIKYPEYITLSITSLNDPNLIKPACHIYNDSKVSWLEIDDQYKRYPKGF